jgi:DNA-binding response OmpR family regulator
VKRHVLVVEDDAGITELLAQALEREGMRAECHRDAESALASLRRAEPDAILLDLGLPGIDGLEFCRLVRRERRTPILILTSRRDEVDKVLGLELGADDYVTKPFGVRELIARVRALIRRAEPAPQAQLRFGDLALDTQAKSVSLAGQAVELTATEYRILETLASSPRRVFSRDEILARLSEGPSEGYERTIDSHLARLRRKLGDGAGQPRFIETVRGLGYRFVG